MQKTLISLTVLISMHKSLVSLVVLATLAATNAFAASTPLTVQATVNVTCYFGDLGNTFYPLLDFGNISDLSADIDTDPINPRIAFAVDCTDSVAYSVSADAGSNESGGQRRMVGSNGGYLPYDLYSIKSSSASAYELVETSGSGALVTAGIGTGTSNGMLYPIFARIPGGTVMPSAGIYTDTVMLTLTY